MFSLIGSESIAAFLAAKIKFLPVVLVLYGLSPGHQLFTDRVFFQGVAHRNFPGRSVFPASSGRWFAGPPCYQPI